MTSLKVNINRSTPVQQYDFIISKIQNFCFLVYETQSFVIVKKINYEALMNLHVLEFRISLIPKKIFLEWCLCVCPDTKTQRVRWFMTLTLKL